MTEDEYAIPFGVAAACGVAAASRPGFGRVPRPTTRCMSAPRHGARGGRLRSPRACRPYRRGHACRRPRCSTRAPSLTGDSWSRRASARRPRPARPSAPCRSISTGGASATFRPRPGGLYVIEDLRWTSPRYGRRAIPNTAALFRKWRHEGTFRRPGIGDPQAPRRGVIPADRRPSATRRCRPRGSPPARGPYPSPPVRRAPNGRPRRSRRHRSCPD